MKLRDELLTVSTSNPTADELNALPYLDYVIRETLRVHAPVPSTLRIATKDNVLPLNTPYTDRKGVAHHEIRLALVLARGYHYDNKCRSRISKGDTIMIPILAMNRSQALWGEDSMEFKCVL
jgi:cytochrome P450